MLEALAQIDRAVFLFINMTLANPVTDFLMPIITSDMILRYLYGGAMLLCLWKGDKRLRWMVLFSALVLTIADQTSGTFIKHWIERPRPCHVMENINLLVHCGGGYAMPSAHAANSFGQAMLFGYFYRSVRWYLMGYAVLISISRIFVGVHYPGDILVGTLVGLAAGLAGIWLYRLFIIKIIKIQPPGEPTTENVEKPIERK